MLWSTSGYEGQSNVILEAMAAGVPVVATDIPGTRELVVASVTGYLVPVGDRASFAKWTEGLLSDAALAGRLAPPPASASRASSAWRRWLRGTSNCIGRCWGEAACKAIVRE